MRIISIYTMRVRVADQNNNMLLFRVSYFCLENHAAEIMCSALIGFRITGGIMEAFSSCSSFLVSNNALSLGYKYLHLRRERIELAVVPPWRRAWRQDSLWKFISLMFSKSKNSCFNSLICFEDFLANISCRRPNSINGSPHAVGCINNDVKPHWSIGSCFCLLPQVFPEIFSCSSRAEPFISFTATATAKNSSAFTIFYQFS